MHDPNMFEGMSDPGLDPWLNQNMLSSQEFPSQLQRYIQFEESDNLDGAPIEDLKVDWVVDQEEETMPAYNQDSPPVNQAVAEPLEYMFMQQGRPASGSYPGFLGFEATVNGADTNKAKYLYSYALNRIYADMKVSVPIQFRWNYELSPGPLSVRATMAFADSSDAEKRVPRCLQHVHESDEEIRHHILRSTRPPNTPGVYYYGDLEDTQVWWSVCVQLGERPPPGQSHITHAFSFHCKSSCSSGINRRPVEIVFTLESNDGRVYGRQTVGVRVCSCPKRDLKKDEENSPQDRGKKRKTGNAQGAPPPDKQLKREPDQELQVFRLPEIVGADNCRLMLEMMTRVMKATLAEDCRSAQDEALVQQKISECETALHQLRRQ